MIVLGAIVLLVSSFALFAERYDGPSHYWYYPLDKTIPLEVEAVISKDADGNWLDPRIVKVDDQDLYIWDAAQENILRFDLDGNFKDKMFQEFSLNVRGGNYGFDASQGNVVVTSNWRIFTKFDGVEKVTRNPYGIDEVAIDGAKIYASKLGLFLGKGKLGEFDTRLKLIRYFGSPPCPGYDDYDLVQNGSYLSFSDGELALVSSELPAFSLNRIDKDIGRRFRIGNFNYEQRKKEVDSSHQYLTPLWVLTSRPDYVDGVLYIPYTYQEFVLIGAFRNGLLEKVYSLDRYNAVQDGEKKPLYPRGIQVVHEPELRFFLHSDREDMPIVKLKVAE